MEAIKGIEAAVEKELAKKEPSREQLAAAVEAEKKERGQRVMAHIQEYCKEHNCLFIATARLEEVPSGGFIVMAYPGVKPL